ncbi:hypothetical protein [Peribacillus sp. AS_2]|uniref:hypothetical protein n=1 Tax=Peribacillus sp. AS_2 TaxID=2996755 RepID=UPI0022A7085D|nr:hypothetical protein [Peribacillus sp. AS_2]MCZ0872735.1 hypothetical protein [Peribacillus sp. AS_2]
MKLDNLIEEGESLRDSSEFDSWGVSKILKGEGLEIWSSKCVIYMDEYSDSLFLIEKVKENAKDLTKDGYEKCLAILGVLKAIKESVNIKN